MTVCERTALKQSQRLQRTHQVQAKYHALVVARDPRLDGPEDLRASDLPLLRHMQVPSRLFWSRIQPLYLVVQMHYQQVYLNTGVLQEVGQQWIDDVHSQDPSAGFRMGFHAIPSMRRLHLHVISQARCGSFMSKLSDCCRMGAASLAVLHRTLFQTG